MMKIIIAIVSLFSLVSLKQIVFYLTSLNFFFFPTSFKALGICLIIIPILIV